MKISWNWLKTFVDLSDVTPEEVASRLTFAGVEVDAITPLSKADHLVIGEILSCVPHPDSNHLHILQVDEGKEFGIHQIVCGAPNARTGLKVIVAREGAKLPEVTIEKSTIRGVESDGMCCALYELGVDKKRLNEKQLSGIEELPSDAPVGETNVLGYLGLDDVILEPDLLANRPDLNAMENVAQEVGCLLDKPVTLPHYEDPVNGESDFRVSSKVAACPTFGAREIRGITTAPSPLWLKQILESGGVRSINNVVDIGNFVMLLTGQPINMYDADKLETRSLEVRDDYQGDFVAMDEKTYALQAKDLVVCSGKEVGCLAGIMTSASCAVTENTKNVIIEAATFAGASIRHTSRRLGLASESSARFVKGINPDQTAKVLTICSALMKELCQAKEVLSIPTYDAAKHETKVIATSLSYLNGRLGTNLAEDEVLSVLRRDHMGITKGDGDTFTVAVPSYRIDMDGAADVSEEVIRLLGYDRIHSKLPIVETAHGGFNEKQKNQLAVRRYLRDIGLSEVITYSLVNQAQKDAFAVLTEGENYQVINPLTEDHEYLRKNLLASLLDVASYNVAHQEKNLAFFEVSDVDTPSTKGRHLAMVEVGEESLQGSWKKVPYDFYSVKGVLEGILNLLGFTMSRFQLHPYVDTKEEFHPARTAILTMGKQKIAVLGELHPNAKKRYGLGKAPVAVMELDLDTLLSLRTGAPKASLPPRFPSVTRDLAFVVDQKVTFDDIRRSIVTLNKKIHSVEVFDVYQGENIPSGKKSMAISITFLDEEKTLTDGEVATLMKNIQDTLSTKFLAEVRAA